LLFDFFIICGKTRRMKTWMKDGMKE